MVLSFIVLTVVSPLTTIGALVQVFQHMRVAVAAYPHITIRNFLA